jgi:hypothetical protein
MMEKRRNNLEFKFPSRLKLSKSESDLVNCNLFPEDYNEYNATKRLI